MPERPFGAAFHLSPISAVGQSGHETRGRGWSADHPDADKIASAELPAHSQNGRSAVITAGKRLWIAFESAGIEFIDPNGGGAGVRFKEP